MKIFSCRIEFTTLAATHNAVNLGQGFIDYAPPEYFLDIYDQTIKERNTSLHQYTRGFVNFHLNENIYLIDFDKIGPSTIS